MKQVEVTIQIPTAEMSEEQRKHFFEAEKHLFEAGISFDTGMDLGSRVRDWEFDWSLKGAQVMFHKFSDGKTPSGKPISS